MTWIPISPSSRAAAALVAVTALTLGLTGCRAGQVAIGTSSTSAQAPATAVTAAPAASSGSVTASITAPITLAGTVATAVPCTTTRRYRASASSAMINGNQVTFTVAIAGYRGPGNYPAVVSMSVHQASGTVTTLAGVSKVPAAITEDGGSFTVSATGAEGRTLSGSLTWVCGS